MIAAGCEGGQLRDQPSRLVEQLLGSISAHPRLEHRELIGVGPGTGQRNLMGAERALDGQAVQLARTGPPLRRTQHYRGPAGTSRDTILACLALDGPDLLVAAVECRS